MDAQPSHPSQPTPPPYDVVEMKRDTAPWADVFDQTPAPTPVDPVEMERDESPWTDMGEMFQKQVETPSDGASY